MGFSPLQAYMDTQENWLQQGGTSTANQQERRMESSPPLGDILTGSTTLSAEKKLMRPAQNDQPLKCPRCDSTHTKFCYYNNYSLSQPRYFCKACRRYWTKGGSLRNIPVGGGCRKNKRDVSLKKSSQQDQSSHDGTTDLRLSYPHQLQFSLANNGDRGINGFMESKYNSLFENHRQFDFLENKFGRDFMENNTDLGHATTSHCDPTSSFHDHFSQYAGMPFTGHLMNTSQRLMLPFDGYEESNAIEVKPNKQLLSLDWQDQESFVGYNNYNGMGSWNGLD